MATDKQREAAEAVARLGSVAAAAREIGITPSTVQQRLRGYRNHSVKHNTGSPVPVPEGFVVRQNSAQYDATGRMEKQWVKTGQGNTDEWVVPEGHTVKGESVLLDANSNVVAKWVKTKEESASAGLLVPALQEAFSSVVPAPAILSPRDTENDYLTVYPLPDLHFGMYSWGMETGEKYDADIAAALVRSTVETLVGQSRPSRHAIVLGLGDYFHSNDQTHATPAHKHRLDADGRWAKIYHAGAHLASGLVEAVASKHENVEALFLPGNHDPDAAVTLGVALSMYFHNTPRIHVNLKPGLVWYRRFNKVLLGATHGHTMKPDRMAMMLATDRPADWGASNHCHFFFGHIHHETAKEIGRVRVESFSTPAAKDSHAHGGGYRAGRALSAITFHGTDGEVGRHRVNIIAPVL